MGLEHLLAIAFLMVGLVSVSSYTDELVGIRIPLFFKELNPMRQRWGDPLGTALHVLQYVIIPIGIGVLLLLNSSGS